MSGGQFAQLRDFGTSLARRATMVAALHNALRRDPNRRLDTLYRWRDPWGMDSEREQYRFRATNALLTDVYGSIDSMLEVGCGEGHHSRHLTTVCGQLTGIDVSARATARAAARVPDATFLTGPVAEQSWAAETGRFDVVVACEVLYYVQDLDGMLVELECISRRGVFLTSYEEGMSLVSDSLESRPGLQRAAFRYAEQVWEAAWWPPPPA